MGITQANVSRLLTAAGYPVSERTLIQWRQRGLLPPLRRASPGAGQGPRAAYVWDNEVLTQAFSLQATLGLRRRVEMAQVLTWFAGYEYSIEVMKDRWASIEESPWQSTLRHAVRDSPDQPFLVSYALEIIGIDARLAGRRRKLSDAFIDVSTRLTFDPNFDPDSEVSDREAEQIRRDLPTYFKDDRSAAAAFALLLTADDIKSFLRFIQRYWSRPKLVALIRDLPTGLLAQVHRDMRFMMSPYRAWLAEGLVEVQRTGDPSNEALFLGPRFGPRLGRFLMLADLQMRWWGYGPQIDQMIAYLNEWLSIEENQHGLQRVRSDFLEIAPMGVSDRAAVQREWERRAQSPEYERLKASGRALVDDLTAIWGSPFRVLFKRIESALNERADVLSAHPELAARFASLVPTTKAP